MEIIFHGLHTGLSVTGDGTFQGGRLIFDPRSHSIDPLTRDRYQNVIGIVLEMATLPDDINELQSLLFSKYEHALALLSAIAGRYRTYAYFIHPMRCEVEDEKYILREHLFEKENYIDSLHIIGGGSYCRDLTFLGRNRSPSYFLDFYREAKDETKPLDYRTLQLWRFFEGWFKLKDTHLKNKLLTLRTYEVEGGFLPNNTRRITQYRITRRLVNSFYRYFRCAVAHGGGAQSWQAKKVILPRHAHTDGDMFSILLVMLDIADYLLGNASKSRF